MARYLAFFPKQTYPIRSGVHTNTAFGLGFEHTIPEWRFGPGERTYGHNGSGGVHNGSGGDTSAAIEAAKRRHPSTPKPETLPEHDEPELSPAHRALIEGLVVAMRCEGHLPMPVVAAAEVRALDELWRES